jgi:hypothetical protein
MIEFKKDWHAGYTLARPYKGQGDTLERTRPLQIVHEIARKPNITRRQILENIGIVEHSNLTAAEFNDRHRGQHTSVFAALTRNEVIEYNPKTRGYLPGKNWIEYMNLVTTELKRRA